MGTGRSSGKGLSDTCREERSFDGQRVEHVLLKIHRPERYAEASEDIRLYRTDGSASADCRSERDRHFSIHHKGRVRGKTGEAETESEGDEK